VGERLTQNEDWEELCSSRKSMFYPFKL